MMVVTNLGSVSYLVKNQKYDFTKAVTLFNEAVDINNKAEQLKKLQKAAEYFLNKYNTDNKNAMPNKIGRNKRMK